MKWFIKCFRHYADFNGRARRKEYWMFVLFVIVFGAVLALGSTLLLNYINNYSVNLRLSHTLPEEQMVEIVNRLYVLCKIILISRAVIGIIYIISLILPSMAVAVRRLHDIGKSGWNYFIGLIPFVGAIILLVWFCRDSQSGENEYGLNPKTS